MSREQSDGEDSVVETEVGPVDDETAETEVDFRLFFLEHLLSGVPATAPTSPAQTGITGM